jgi:hypothetical protein
MFSRSLQAGPVSAGLYSTNWEFDLMLTGIARYVISDIHYLYFNRPLTFIFILLPCISQNKNGTPKFGRNDAFDHRRRRATTSRLLRNNR